MPAPGWVGWRGTTDNIGETTKLYTMRRAVKALRSGTSGWPAGGGSE